MNSRYSTASGRRDRLPQGTWKLILAASIGNALEWYDLAIHAFVAPLIARQFFPTMDKTGGLLMAFGTFAISYIARPLGAIWLGAVADAKGRRQALSWAIGLMTAGTAGVALSPTYEQAGLLAPCLLVFARLLQGLSAGGEFGAATAMLVEHAPSRGGFMGSWQVASQGLSTLLASIAGLATIALSLNSAHDAWAWRTPFLFGLLIAPVGLYIRRHLPDDQMRLPISQAAPRPFRQIKANAHRILLAIGLMMGSTSATYVVVYIPTYVQKVLSSPAASGYVSTLVAGLMLTVLPPFVGILSDQRGRLATMRPAAIGLAVSGAPLFLWLEHWPSDTTLLVVTLWLAICKAIYFGALPASLTELFPRDARATGLNVAYNIGVPIFGGLAPLLLTSLVAQGVPAAPGLYLSAMAGLSLVSIAIVKRTGLLRPAGAADHTSSEAEHPPYGLRAPDRNPVV